MKFVAPITMIDPAQYLPLAKAAEEAGFDGIAVSDSVCYPEQSDSRYPYSPDGSREFLENMPFLEPMVALSAIAVATSTIELMPFVLKLPIRHPVLFAKQVTSLGVLSGGRFRLGVGTSPWPDDYEVVGMPWQRRAQRFEECINIIRGLSSGEYYGHKGEFYEFAPVKINPVSENPVPILVAGNSPAMLRRAARVADGWITIGLENAELETAIDVLRNELREQGRENAPFAIHTAAPADLDALCALAELGVTHAHSSFPGPRPVYDTTPDDEPLEAKIERTMRFGEEVISTARRRLG